MRATRGLYEQVGRWLPNLIASVLFIICFWILLKNPERIFGAGLGIALVLIVWFWWWYNPSSKQESNDK